VSSAGATVLIVEDDDEARAILVRELGSRGYRTQEAADGRTAMERWEASRPDIVLLDLGLPDIDGLEVIRRIRRDAMTPIVILSGRYAEREKVEALERGADDYVTKPFGLAELRSRIRAVLRRAHGRVVDGVRAVGPVTIDQRERQVTVGGSPVRLTFSEYELLACLMERPGKLFTRQELLRAIWGDSAYRDPRAIDVHIRHLREKLEERPEEPSLILTVRGAGYRFREQ
jgi:DNA-binding response OmpR family regulator